MQPLGPVDTAPLFPGLHGHLVTLLRGLDRRGWTKPTVAGSWTVHDVVAHMIDGQIRRLSAQRDDHQVRPERDVSSFPALVAYLNELNATWVGAMKRASPRVLLDMLDGVGSQYAAFVATLHPDAPALFPVSWAGESESKSWFDIGRDYTELWHHQAQIRLAVGTQPLEQRRWLGPVFELSARALKRALAAERPPDQTAVTLHVEGEAGGTWSAVAGPEGWSVYAGAAPRAAATVRMPQSLAWKLLFHAVKEPEAERGIESEGDGELVRALLRTRSVMV